MLSVRDTFAMYRIHGTHCFSTCICSIMLLFQDLVAMRAVARFGGWAIDLDILQTPIGLPALTSRPFFSSEPTRGPGEWWPHD